MPMSIVQAVLCWGCSRKDKARQFHVRPGCAYPTRKSLDSSPKLGSGNCFHASLKILVPLLPQNCSKLSPMNFALWLLPWYPISPFWLKPRSMPDITKFNFLLWYSIFWTFWSQRLAVSSSVSDFDIFGTIITPCYSRYYLLVSPGPNPFLRSRAPPLRTLNCARIYLQP